MAAPRRPKGWDRQDKKIRDRARAEKALSARIEKNKDKPMGVGSGRASGESND